MLTKSYRVKQHVHLSPYIPLIYIGAEPLMEPRFLNDFPANYTQTKVAPVG